MPNSGERQLIELAAAVACELSEGQARALAVEVERLSTPRVLRRVAGMTAPTSVVDLTEQWVSGEALSPQTLATAIRCASRAVKATSSYEKVELLYTGPESDIRRNVHGLLDVIRSAKERLWIVSYVVVGVDEVLRSLEERASSGVEVNILLDHVPDGFTRTRADLVRHANSCRLFVWPDEHRLVPTRCGKRAFMRNVPSPTGELHSSVVPT